VSHGFHRSLIHGIPLVRLPFPPGSGRAVQVRAHWLLLVVPLWELLSRTLATTAPFGAPFLSWGASMVALALSLLLHELGHLLWTEKEGGRTERSLLWPLGGATVGELPEDPGAHLRVAAAGLAATALGLAGAAAACLASGWELLPPAEAPASFPYVQALCQYLVLWQALLLAVNLLPCVPLDGGRLLEAALWSRLESHWQARAVARKVGIAAAIGAGTAAVFLFFASFFVGKDYALHHPFLLALSWGLALALVMFYCEIKLEELRSGPGDDDESVFGYDFSGGYTSLERTTTRRPKKTPLLGRLRDAFRRRARARKAQDDEAMKLRLDELLRKIHDRGMDSLTATERRFLERASRHLRR